MRYKFRLGAVDAVDAVLYPVPGDQRRSGGTTPHSSVKDALYRLILRDVDAVLRPN